MIRRIESDARLAESVPVIRDSFITAAHDFGLTPENAPTNPAFISLERLHELKAKGAVFFGLYEHDAQIGFVAIERANDSLYFMEKLAVLPDKRHGGRGRALVDFVHEYVKQRGGEKISIGIIDENKVLKSWYAGLGYVETGIRRFPHLPFAVCFMERAV